MLSPGYLLLFEKHTPMSFTLVKTMISKLLKQSLRNYFSRRSTKRITTTFWKSNDTQADKKRQYYSYRRRQYSHTFIYTQSGSSLHKPFQWRHNELDGVSNHRRPDCLLSRLSRRRSKKRSKLRVTGFCEGNSPVIGEFPTQRTSNAENVSIWWRHPLVRW